MDEIDLAQYQALYGRFGVWALPVIGVILSIRLYRIDSVQALLPLAARWASLPLWARAGLVCLTAVGASLVTSLLAGLGWQAALWAALPVALGAVFGHESTRVLGHALQSSAEGKALELGQPYVPSPYRKVASLVLPLRTELPKITPAQEQSTAN